jgi:hypothetical protein
VRAEVYHIEIAPQFLQPAKIPAKSTLVGHIRTVSGAANFGLRELIRLKKLGRGTAPGFLLALCVISVGNFRLDRSSDRPRDASQFPGASIVEKIQAAIDSCGADPCVVTIPAGRFKASSIKSWPHSDRNNSKVGISVPSSVTIDGGGQAQTFIEVTRAPNDPPATLFENSGPKNENIRISNLSVNWEDSASTFNWVSIMLFRKCDRLELDHLHLQGNPNKLVNLLDGSRAQIHDNLFDLLSTSYGFGNNSLSFGHFDSAATVPATAGVVRDNEFTVTAAYPKFSMLVLSQSGIDVSHNIFANPSRPKQNDTTAIEMGADNTGRLPENVRISENTFRGSSIAYGGLSNSEIVSNNLFHGDIYIALQDGTVASLSGLTIADNELHFGSIVVNGLEKTMTSHVHISENRISDGNISIGNPAFVTDVEVIGNSVKYSDNHNGIDCNACSLIRNNSVRDVGQNAPGDKHAGYQVSGSVLEMSGNAYIDDQREYSGGTICSAPSADATDCSTSGNSRWILLKGGEWGRDWVNRTLYTNRGNFLIRAFTSNSTLELEDDIDPLPQATAYHLYVTTFSAFALFNAKIDRFANNLADAPYGSFRSAAIQEAGTINIGSMSGNEFTPYTCRGTCSVDYRGTSSGTKP